MFQKWDEVVEIYYDTFNRTLAEFGLILRHLGTTYQDFLYEVKRALRGQFLCVAFIIPIGESVRACLLTEAQQPLERGRGAARWIRNYSINYKRLQLGKSHYPLAGQDVLALPFSFLSPPSCPIRNNSFEAQKRDARENAHTHTFRRKYVRCACYINSLMSIMALLEFRIRV